MVGVNMGSGMWGASSTKCMSSGIFFVHVEEVADHGLARRMIGHVVQCSGDGLLARPLPQACPLPLVDVLAHDVELIVDVRHVRDAVDVAFLERLERLLLPAKFLAHARPDHGLLHVLEGLLLAPLDIFPDHGMAP